MAYYITSVLVLLVALGLAWAAGPLLHLQGHALLLFRVIAVTTGVLFAVILVWLGIRARRAAAGDTAADAGGDAPLDALLRDAARKLSSAQRSGPRKLAALPLLYLLGDTNSAKTTAVVKSGLDPELLAGQVYRDSDIVSTAVANFWYTRDAVIVEPGEALRQDAGLWSRLVVRTRPLAYRSAFGRRAPFRGAVVCLSCERLLGLQTPESLQAAARAIGDRLRELARLLGASVPVYVLFTKLDRIPHFAEFGRLLTGEEAQEPLGIALPRLDTSAGVYAETATRAIDAGYDRLLSALAEYRLEVLPRESDPTQAGGAYEFPREMRKLRNTLSAYLVEMLRPSHLSANPYLRGVYFTGVRSVLTEQAVSAPAPLPGTAVDAGATRVFSRADFAQAPRPAAPAYATHKMAQWTFLPRFFPGVVLGDREALAETGEGARGAIFRRSLFGAICVLLLAYLAMLCISFSNNRGLEERITRAAAASDTLGAPPAGLASTRQLAALDQLRSSLAQLEDYRRNGPPLLDRWGLYHGDALLAAARPLYFARFRSLLLEPTQANLVAALRALPNAPASGAGDYGATYAALRAYLITTSNADKSTPEFLTPVLLQYWQNGRTLQTEEQRALAQQQFAYYAEELRRGNPYTIEPVRPAVEHARRYLSAFGGFERIYQSMLQAANKAAPGIDFNRQFPRSAETVIDNHSVPGAFTPAGYAFMEDALAHPQRYFNGEAWVLGDQAAPSLDPATLRQQIASRYTNDYISEWRTFLRDAAVVRYRNLPDAGVKLSLLTANNSPLLALVYTVSHNTSVANPQIAAAFQAPQALVPPTSKDQYIGAGNKAYIDALLALQGSVAQAGQSASTDAAAAGAPVAAAASAAEIAAQQAAQAFRIDPQGHVDQTVLALMKAPIVSAQGLVRALGPAQANAAGKGLCGAFNAVFAKFPFSPAAAVQATPAEVAGLLAPNTGALWQFYNTSLKTALLPQGAQYAPAPNAPLQLTPAFLRFFNRAAALSQELFPNGPNGPALNFTLRSVPSKGINNLTFSVDAQKLTGMNVSQNFTWSAQTAQAAQLTANDLPLVFEGPWAIFELVNKARVQRSAGIDELEFPIEVSNTPVRAPDGTPLVARFALTGPGAPALIPGALSLRCVPEVAR